MLYKRTRFSDFAPREKIATNILADRLEKLEQAGILIKQRDDVLKNQNIYSVTQKGKDLVPTLVEMTLWGLQYDEQTPASSDFVNRIAKDHRLFADEMSTAVESGAFVEYRQNRMGVGAK